MALIISMKAICGNLKKGVNLIKLSFRGHEHNWNISKTGRGSEYINCDLRAEWPIVKPIERPEEITVRIYSKGLHLRQYASFLIPLVDAVNDGFCSLADEKYTCTEAAGFICIHLDYELYYSLPTTESFDSNYSLLLSGDQKITMSTGEDNPIEHLKNAEMSITNYERGIKGDYLIEREGSERSLLTSPSRPDTTSAVGDVEHYKKAKKSKHGIQGKFRRTGKLLTNIANAGKKFRTTSTVSDTTSMVFDNDAAIRDDMSVAGLTIDTFDQSVTTRDLFNEIAVRSTLAPVPNGQLREAVLDAQSVDNSPRILGTPSLRRKGSIASSYCEGLKPQNFQVTVRIIEARQLVGLNMDPFVIIDIGKQQKLTSSKDQTNCPYFNEFFAFDFAMPASLFFDQMITIKVCQVKRVLRQTPIIGTFKMDLHTVYNQPDHQFYHKWAVLTDPDEPQSGPRGYVKCNIVVSTKGEASTKPPLKSDKDDDDIDSNLLLPKGTQIDRQRARYIFRVYRADGLPSSSTGLMSSMRKALTFDSTSVSLDPFVQITFAGTIAKTSIRKETNKPIWNEELVFTDLFPPLFRRIKIQVRDEALNGGAIATHFLDISSISNESRSPGSTGGFIPSFGPNYIYLYGSVRDPNLFGDKSYELNKGLGEGVAYRGRLLLSLDTEMLEVTTSPAASVEPVVQQCPPILSTTLGKLDELFLFCTLLDVSMIDTRLCEKKVYVELSFGNYGNVLDVGAIQSDSEDESEPPEEASSWRSNSSACHPVMRDGTAYLPFNDRKPCLYIKSTWYDQRRRLYLTNSILRLKESLEKGLFTTEIMIEREANDVDTNLRMVLDQFAANCSRSLQLIRGTFNQMGGRNKLDKNRQDLQLRELDHMLSACRTLKQSIVGENVAEKLRKAYEFADHLEELANEPQPACPDAFMWLVAGKKRIAYRRFSANDLIWSTIEAERGSQSGSVHSFFLNLPEGQKKDTSLAQSQAYVTAYFWLGLNRSKVGFLRGLPSGYPVSKEVSDAEKANCLPPVEIVYIESHIYELRCYLFQARSLIGMDESGLSDPYANIIFEGRSKQTQIITQTVSPTWDELLYFPDIVIHGSAASIKQTPRNVVVQLFDSDQVGKDEYIGQIVASCNVKLFDEAYESPFFPAKLQWQQIYRGQSRAGELLAAFELIQLAPRGKLATNHPALPMPTKYGAKGEPLMAVPHGIRPNLVKFRIEVLFWGLRDVRRLNMMAVERPKVDIECAGMVITSPPILHFKKNPNFSSMLKSFDVDLPDSAVFWPPITIRCLDTKSFGRSILVGTHTINAIDKFIYQPIVIPDNIDNCSNEEPIIVNIDGEPALIMDGASDMPARKVPILKPLHRKVPAEELSLDWWSKYYASIELMQKESKKKDALFNNNLTLRLNPDKNQFRFTDRESDTDDETVFSFNDDKSSKSPVKEISKWLSSTKTKKKSKREKKLKIATLKIYTCELENVVEFNQFHDVFYKFDLFRGKLKHDESNVQDTGDCIDSSRLAGRFKGNLKICRHPIPSECSKTFFRQIPSSNEPVNVLVRIYVVKAYDLHPADINGKADPYIIIRLGKNTINDKENYISKQLNPVFGKCYEIESTFPKDSQLSVSIFDWDLIGYDDLIGETRIDLETRYYSKHRATCGVGKIYDTCGYNVWRDPCKPSVILAKLCKEYGLSDPIYSPRQIRISGKLLTLPSDAKCDMIGSKFDREPLALYALQHWIEVPRVGCHLVPEHIETRRLYHPDKSGIEQGRIEMWIDMFPMDMPSPPDPVDISPRKPKSFELRVIICNTEDVVLQDDAFITGEKMSDIYVKGWLKGNEDSQQTDVHFRSLTGEGNFNWRFIYPFDYLEAEEKIVISRKENFFSWDENEVKIPARLMLQVWDADHFSPDDFLGSFNLDLCSFPRGAKSSRNCSLKMMESESEIPRVNIFKARRVKGWWPFSTKNEFGDEELTGKVEAEIHLLTADEAEKSPVGLGRNEPDPLEKPNRPDASFVWFMNPLKSFRYIVWHNYKKLIIQIILLILLSLILFLFIYSTPGYIVKKMLAA